jgi:hypothetical protein
MNDVNTKINAILVNGLNIVSSNPNRPLTLLKQTDGEFTLEGVSFKVETTKQGRWAMDAFQVSTTSLSKNNVRFFIFEKTSDWEVASHFTDALLKYVERKAEIEADESAKAELKAQSKQAKEAGFSQIIDVVLKATSDANLEAVVNVEKRTITFGTTVISHRGGEIRVKAGTDQARAVYVVLGALISYEQDRIQREIVADEPEAEAVA